MTLGIFEALLNIVQEAFGDLFLEKLAKAIEKLRQFLAAQGVQLSPCAKVLQIKISKRFTKGW